MSAPGLIGTLRAFFRAGTSDPSVATRVNDYPLVERLVHEAPWFGHGGGTYIVDNAFDILDNQYLKTAIELGLVGVLALAAYFLVPTIVALVARRRSGDPELRLLCAALAGAALAAAVCSLTFDSLSFPMFANVHALVIGLVGAGWRLAARGRAPAIARPRRPSGAPYRDPPPTPEPSCRREADRGPAPDCAKDLALQAGDAAGDRPHALWRGVRRRRQGPGVRGDVQLRPDQPACAADGGGDRPRPGARTCQRRQPLYAFRRPVGGRPGADRRLEQRVGTASAR